MGTVIDFQHIFHRRYECAVRLGRDNPLLSDVRFENVFFSTRPIVLSLALSTILSSTTFSSSNRNVQRTYPLGGLEQVKAISFASFSPSKILETAASVRKLLIVLLTGFVILATGVVGVGNVGLDSRVEQTGLLLKRRDRDQLRLQQIYQSDLTGGAGKGKEQ
jgi:hypothetical protein